MGEKKQIKIGEVVGFIANDAALVDELNKALKILGCTKSDLMRELAKEIPRVVDRELSERREIEKSFSKSRTGGKA